MPWKETTNTRLTLAVASARCEAGSHSNAMSLLPSARLGPYAAAHALLAQRQCLPGAAAAGRSMAETSHKTE